MESGPHLCTHGFATANTFYNSQKSDLEILSGRVIELDSMLRDYGPNAQPIRQSS